MKPSIQCIDVVEDNDDGDTSSVSSIHQTNSLQYRQQVVMATIDRPPRSPVRTTSKKVPSFTRSRVFPSIRRKRKVPIVGISVFQSTMSLHIIHCKCFSRCDTSIVRWMKVCLMWCGPVLLWVYIYWYNVQTILTSRLLHIQPPLQQHKRHSTSNMISTSTYPLVALTNFTSQQQQPIQRRMRYRQENKGTLKSYTTINSIVSRNNSTLPRTKEDRIAPLLEIINFSTIDGTIPKIIRKIHRLPTRTTSDWDGVVPSCIVTAYFKLPNSKHDINQYDQWMQNMLSMHDCMVIYCEADMVSTILQYRTSTTVLRSNHTTVEVQSFGPTAIIEMSLIDLPISKYYSNKDASSLEFWNRQLQMDPEHKLHKSYELFWIWLSKSWFVTTAAIWQHHIFMNHRMNATTIGTWMWADIGSFRGTEYLNQPLIQGHDQVIPDNDTVLWMAHRKPNPPSDPYWNRKLLKKEKKYFYHSGSQAIANSITAWIDFHIHFVHTLDEYAARDLFLGEDQCVLQTTCLLYPKSCAYVPHHQIHDNKYFGLRHVVHYGISNLTNSTGSQHPILLWRPPLLQPINTTRKK